MEFLLTFLAKMTILVKEISHIMLKIPLDLERGISKVFTMDQKQFRVYAKKYRILLCRR